MAKIYVSSTFIDLQDHRAQVERIIRRMGHEDVAMEYYVAEDQRPVDRCLSDVAACDLYIGIFAWRYGWIPKKNNRKKLSITEMEYRQAEKTGKPCLIFLLDGKAPWPPDFIDDDKIQIKRLRNELSEKHSTGPGFKSVDELGRLVAEAIHKWEKEHGYIPSITSIPEYNLDAYYQALRKRYQTLALEGLTPPQKDEYLQIQLRSVFVEQNVRESPPPVELPKEVWEKLQRDKDVHAEDLPSGITFDDVRRAREVYFEKPSRPVLEVLTDSRHQQTIILGDPGSGKSTLARYIMLSLIDPSSDEKLRDKFDGYLPLLIELRTYVGLCLEKRCETPLEFFDHLGKTEGWALTKVALHNYLKNDGHAIVIFDGLDEIFDPEQRERVTHQIVGFTNDYPQARIIVTSRAIGYRRKILTDAGFTHFTLQDLDEKQVETFVNRWYDLAMSDRPDEAKERQERILKSFKESASIRQLAGNPMLLTIMAIIGKHQELPRERWKLYDHAASVLIQHWDVNKHLKDQRVEADFIGEDDKKELLRRLAFKMQGAEAGLAGNYLHRDELQAEFESYLIERYSQTPDRAKVIAEMMIQQFRERNFILSLYGANLYGFVHRAFLEYFCASAFVWKFEKTKELTIEQLKTDVYGKHWEDQSWHEVLRLICGMVDLKWAKNIIIFLMKPSYSRMLDSKILVIDRKASLPALCFCEIKSFWEMDDITKEFLKHDNWVARSDLVKILKESDSRQPKAFQLLSELAEKDTSWIVINEAISVLVEQYRESDKFQQQLLEQLIRWANEAKRADLRKEALFHLSDSFPNEFQTIKVLYDRIKDEERDIQELAIEILIKKYPYKKEVTRSHLINCAIDEKISWYRWYNREVTIKTLGTYYNQDEEHIIPTLKKIAKEDKHVLICESAIGTLVEHYKTKKETWLFLNKILENDKRNNHVRRAIIQKLSQCPFAEQKKSILRRCVLHDDEVSVRKQAMIALIENNDDQLLNIIYARAINDTNFKSWFNELSALVEKCYYSKNCLSFLQDLSRKEMPFTPNDKIELAISIRDAAISLIAKYWPDHPDTLPLLKDRAKNDPTPWLRERAKKLIKELTEAKKKE